MPLVTTTLICFIFRARALSGENYLRHTERAHPCKEMKWLFRTEDCRALEVEHVIHKTACSRITRKGNSKIISGKPRFPEFYTVIMRGWRSACHMEGMCLLMNIGGARSYSRMLQILLSSLLATCNMVSEIEVFTVNCSAFHHKADHGEQSSSNGRGKITYSNPNRLTYMLH